MGEINLVNKDTILNNLRPYDWDVVINGVPYYVVRVKGYIHTIGGKWGENDLWAYPRNEAPTYENLIEFGCNEIVAWGIVHNPKNYAKCKWDECEARTGYDSYITRNGEKFCDVHGSIERAKIMISDLQEHPIGFNEIDFDKKVIGRKVWWRSEPAIVDRYIKSQACVMLIPDGISKFTVPAEFYKENMEDYYCDGDVKADVFDKHIWWFRD